MPDYKSPNIVYFVGESNLPSNCVAGQHHSYMAVGLLVDMGTSIILDAYVSLISPLGARFVQEQFIGRRLPDDFDNIIESLQRYRAIAKKSIIVSAKAAFDNYIRYTKEISQK